MNNLYDLFCEHLEDMLSAEHQIIQNLPKLIKIVTMPDLKKALSHHLEETKDQVKRLEQIFDRLGFTPHEETCEAMQGLLKEAENSTKGEDRGPVLDACIIACCQKVEHYEIASYGTLKSFAKQLDLDDQIVDLIDETLNEEGAADKKLTKLAEGSFFTTSVNKQAAEVEKVKVLKPHAHK